MEKTIFIDLIERSYNSQLARYQLQYLFSSSRYVAASCPRRGGKSFIAQLDTLYTCTTPNKKAAIILPNRTSIDAAKANITRMVQALNGYIEIEGTNRDTIIFNNNSVIYLLSGSQILENSRGRRLNKVTIEEPDFIDNIEELINVLDCCMLSVEDAQLKMIGTHSVSKHNLKSYMLNPYYDKITVTADSVYNPMSRQALNEIRSTMINSNAFKLQYLNEITPSLFNN